MCKSALILAIFEKYCHHWKLKVNLQVSSGSEKSSKTAVLALKSPTSAHFMSLCIKFTNSFSISKNALTFLNVMDVNVEDGLFRYHMAMTIKFYLIIIFPQKDILSVKADQIILDENF
jgi:hypothetical protein